MQFIRVCARTEAVSSGIYSFKLLATYIICNPTELLAMRLNDLLDKYDTILIRRMTVKGLDRTSYKPDT